jgi:hypothetical protein
MSNSLAIAAVTATFKDLLGAVTQDPSLAGASVTIKAPDLARKAADKVRQLNLFLYQVAPNPAWRNADLPFRNGGGALTARPVLALNLHYLVTAYGSENDDLDAQHLLAYAMSLVHDNSVLNRERITNVVTAAAGTALGTSDLADQVELVKFTPQPLSDDSLFKLWSAFQTNYRLSTAYEASVVLVDRPHPVTVAPPVRKADLLVVPLDLPVIDSIDPQIAGPASTIIIHGRNLRAAATTVRINALSVIPKSSDMAPTAITLKLPAALSPGLATVQVRRSVELGEPPQPHEGFLSNVMPFLVTPVLSVPPPANVAGGATLALTLVSPVAQAQATTLLLDDQPIPVEWLPADPDPSPTIKFVIPASTPTGVHVVRVQIDGATSEVTRDPITGLVTAPVVTVT